MELNTKQVRKVVNNIAGFAGQWTEKTTWRKKQRRSVTWAFKNAADADKVATQVRGAFATMGVTNRVKRTNEYYLRIAANIS